MVNRLIIQKNLVLIAQGLFVTFLMATIVQAQTGPTLNSATFFGGSGDQRGTGISIRDGSITIAGNVEPEVPLSSSSAGLSVPTKAKSAALSNTTGMPLSMQVISVPLTVSTILPVGSNAPQLDPEIS